MNDNIGVQLHSNGDYWQARWRESTGKRRTESLGAKAKVPKRAALALCRALAVEHAVTPAARDVGRAPTLGEWKGQYLDLRDDLKTSTAKMHEVTFRYLTARFGEDCRLDRITEAAAEDFRVWLGKQPKKDRPCENRPRPTLGPQTVAGHIRNCKTIFERARRIKAIPYNPFKDVNGNPPAVAKDWAEISEADLVRILEKCPGPSWRCLFALARLAGLRRGEGLRLTWADVDFDARTVAVWPDGGIETSKQRARSVPISPALFQILREAYDMAEEGAALVCPGICSDTVHARAAKIIKAAGLPAYSKPFHTLRKNLESHWLAEFPTMIVCGWLGHSPTIAMMHYHRPRAEDIARVTGVGLKGTEQAQKT